MATRPTDIPIPVNEPAEEPAPPPETPPTDAATPQTAESPTKTGRGDLLELSEVDTQPTSIRRELPSYTRRGRLMRQQGTVMLNLLIDETGHVSRVEVLEGIPRSDLNDAAVEAARDWLYEPATKDGVPVRVWKVEKIVFRL